jgi:hypothetical protein
MKQHRLAISEKAKIALEAEATMRRESIMEVATDLILQGVSSKALDFAEDILNNQATYSPPDVHQHPLESTKNFIVRQVNVPPAPSGDHQIFKDMILEIGDPASEKAFVDHFNERNISKYAGMDIKKSISEDKPTQDMIKALFKEGKSRREIAKIINRPKSSVIAWIAKNLS